MKTFKTWLEATSQPDREKIFAQAVASLVSRFKAAGFTVVTNTVHRRASAQEIRSQEILYGEDWQLQVKLDVSKPVLGVTYPAEIFVILKPPKGTTLKLTTIYVDFEIELNCGHNLFFNSDLKQNVDTEIDKMLDRTPKDNSWNIMLKQGLPTYTSFDMCLEKKGLIIEDDKHPDTINPAKFNELTPAEQSELEDWYQKWKRVGLPLVDNLFSRVVTMILDPSNDRNLGP